MADKDKILSAIAEIDRLMTPFVDGPNDPFAKAMAKLGAEVMAAPFKEA